MILKIATNNSAVFRDLGPGWVAGYSRLRIAGFNDTRTAYDFVILVSYCGADAKIGWAIYTDRRLLR